MEKTPLLDSSPQRSRARFSRTLKFTLVSVALLTLYGALRRKNVSSDSYAVCSAPGTTQIYTVDSNDSRVECIHIQGSHIVMAGDRSKQSLFHPRGQLPASLDCVQTIPEGAIVLPGLSDSHGHIFHYGSTRQLVLEGTGSLEETVALVRNYVLENPEVRSNKDSFIFGAGWDHMSWDNTEWPTAAAFEADPILKGRKIVLDSKDLHAYWISQRVLDEIAFPDEVEGGEVMRDGLGKPTGVLMDMAKDLVKIPELTNQDLRRQFRVTARDALSLGLTSLHDAGLTPTTVDFFDNEAKHGTLPIRVYGMLFFNDTSGYWGADRRPIIGAADGRFTMRSVKIVADGALRSGTAALYEPYSDNPASAGFLRLPAELIHESIPKFLHNGWQVNVHAIGDKTNAVVLDAFEAALGESDVSALRPRIEHAQIIRDADIARLGKLGVIASIQPTHAVSDMWFGEDRLGPERVKMLYPFRSIWDSGSRVTFGSDFPVETINPLAGFYSAITRLAFDGTSPHGSGGWFPAQRLTRQEALRAMTINPAYASFTEDALGSLEPGKRADYVVLSQDIMSVKPENILRTRVLATALDGEVVYGGI